jgi:thiamine biosynthesis lipoprotein
MVRWQNTAKGWTFAAVFGLLTVGLPSSLVAREQGAGAQVKRYIFTEAHLGTVVRLVFYSADREQAKALAKRCFDRVRHLDGVFSDYRDDSELMKLSKVADRSATRVSNEMFTVLVCAQHISRQSGGAFDVTLGASTKAWRAKKQGKDARAVPGQGIASCRDLVLDEAGKTVRFTKPLSLDLGGIAKGYIADELARLLREGGATQHAVAVGGEMVVGDPPSGRKGWGIDLESPEQKVIATVELSHAALSTSGDSYQFARIDGKRSAHVLDPNTGEGKEDLLNVTVIAPTAMQADAWSTAFRVMGVERACELAAKTDLVEACFTPGGGTVQKTPGFPEQKR